jgi:hypothetical protein
MNNRHSNLGRTDDHSQRSILSARLDLSLQRKSVISSFYFGELELHGGADVPDPDVLNRFQNAITYATQGDNSGLDDCRRMRDALIVCLPAQLRSLLSGSLKDLNKGSLVALEVSLNDRALEKYPWELLGEPGILSSSAHPIAVWRNVSTRLPAERPANTGVLLVGSAAVDSIPPFTHEEIGHLKRLLDEYGWITPLPYPSITFGDFSRMLDIVRPAIVHVVAHGSIYGFQFQDSNTFPRSHYDIPPQELAGRLTRSTASVVILNCCDSATVPSDEDSAARRISQDTAMTTIGMAAQLPSSIGILFAEQFYRTIALGSTVIDAYNRAIQQIRDASNFANLWSVPVMYSTEPKIIIFPTDPRARVRLSLSEISSHLTELEEEIESLAGYQDWSPGDWAEHTAKSEVRVAYAQDALGALTITLNQQPIDLFDALSLRQGCDDLECSLEGISECLSQLTDPRSSPDDCARAFDVTVQEFAIMRHALERINGFLAEMR